MERINITIPKKEHDQALKQLPYGEARSFSALVRMALQKLPKKRR